MQSFLATLINFRFDLIRRQVRWLWLANDSHSRRAVKFQVQPGKVHSNSKWILSSRDCLIAEPIESAFRFLLNSFGAICYACQSHCLSSVTAITTNSIIATISYEKSPKFQAFPCWIHNFIIINSTRTSCKIVKSLQIDVYNRIQGCRLCSNSGQLTTPFAMRVCVCVCVNKHFLAWSKDQ